jgi:hypothetical protein
MADKSNFQRLIEDIAPRTLIQLSSFDAGRGGKAIREHLSNLLRSCTGTSKFEEPERSTRLLICLDAFYHIAKLCTLLPDEDYEMVFGYVLSTFKDIVLVRELWYHSNPAIRVNSRFVCAYLSRNLLRKPYSKIKEWERRLLQDFVGKPEREIFSPLVHLSVRDHWNLQSFVFGVLSGQTDGLSVKDAARFAETLAVLMNAGSSGALHREIFSEEISSFIEWVEKGDHQHRDEVVSKLREMFRDLFI